MNKIYIQNRQDSPINAAQRGLIRRVINAALKYEKFPLNAEISVTLADNAGIHKLNKEHRGVDRPTDVLSFPLYEADEIDEMYESEEASDEPIALGDIVISLEKAWEQAQEYGHSMEREVAFLCVHSVLHLLGYDHELGDEEEKEMFARQEEMLTKMDITR